MLIFAFSNFIGIIAGSFTAASLLPQLIKIIKEKKADDISVVMLLILFAGLASWIYYGFLKKDYPIIITNSFSLLVNSLIIIFRIKYKKE